MQLMSQDAGDILGISLGYLGDILGICWGYVGDIFGILLVYLWDIFESSCSDDVLVYIRPLFEILSIHAFL